MEDIAFVFVNPNEDVPSANERRVRILDTVQKSQNVALVEGDGIDGLILSPHGSVHDFDLAFQLRYLRKLNKLGKVTIIGTPQEGAVDYLSIQSIFRSSLSSGNWLHTTCKDRRRVPCSRHSHATSLRLYPSFR